MERLKNWVGNPMKKKYKIQSITPKDMLEINEYVKENGFIDKLMTTIYSAENRIEQTIVNVIATIGQKCSVGFDEARVRKWINFCNRMENIDQETIVDAAVRAKFTQLHNKIAKLEKENQDMRFKIETFLGADYE